MDETDDPDTRKALLLYELFAAAGGNKHPPVAPDLAEMIATQVWPEELAIVERLYRAIERAATDGQPDDPLEAVFARAADYLDNPH